ncbi:MAG: hypothetical protein DRJ97_03690 [Thermoprotei archaeon]|nr:MAG: hypothetical protein DRJ97_03690 [Thermoprotei archaeon]
MGVGLTKVKVKLVNPEGMLERDVELLVDTGSVLTWIKRSRLEELGIKPRRVRRIKTITGQIVERQTGLVTLVLGGDEADVEVVFAEEGDGEVLGVVALESLGYAVNTITGRLERVGYIAYSSFNPHRA